MKRPKTDRLGKHRAGMRMVVLAGSLSLILAGCAGDEVEPDDPVATDSPTDAAPDSEDEWAETVAAAEEEGTVTFCHTVPEVNGTSVGDAFETEYPDIDFEFVRGTSGEMQPRVETERDTGAAGCDVFLNTNHVWIEDAHERGELVPLEGPQVSSDEWQSSDWLVDDTYAATGFMPFVLTWNTELVSEPLNGLEDLVARSEEFQGAVGVLDPHVSPTITNLFAFIEDSMGEEWYTSFAEMDPQLYPGTAPATAAVGSGEVKAALTVVIPPLQALADDGAPVDWVVPPGGVQSGVLFNTGVLSWATNPNAAQVFMDFLMSPDGQAALVRPGGVVSPLPNIPGVAAGPEAIAPMELKAADFVAEYLEYWEDLFQS